MQTVPKSHEREAKEKAEHPTKVSHKGGKGVDVHLCLHFGEIGHRLQGINIGALPALSSCGDGASYKPRRKI